MPMTGSILPQHSAFALTGCDQRDYIDQGVKFEHEEGSQTLSIVTRRLCGQLRADQRSGAPSFALLAQGGRSRMCWEGHRVESRGIPPFAKSAKDGAPERWSSGRENPSIGGETQVSKRDLGHPLSVRPRLASRPEGAGLGARSARKGCPSRKGSSGLACWRFFLREA